MAISFTMTEWIDAPPERVYAIATDLPGAGAWMQNLVRVEMLTDGEFRTGTRWREVRKMFGKEAAEEFEVRACEPGRSFTLYVDGSKGASKRGEYLFEHRLEAENGGTRFTMDASMSGMGWLGKILGPIMKGGFKKAIEKDNRALKAYIESQSA